MFNWFMGLSIRWKLQFAFFAVTMVTTIYNRMLASHELGKMVEIAREGHVAEQVLAQLQSNHSAYVFNSFWESGIEFVLQFFLISFIANIFVRPIRNLCHSLEWLEKGDLTRHVENRSRDEIGVLEKIFNSVLVKLNNIMREIEEGGKNMSQSAYQVARISHEISDVSKQQESRSSEAVAAMQRMLEVSSSVKSQADEAAERSRNTEARAREGIETVRRNIVEMEHTAQEVDRGSREIQELGEAAQQIHRIISSITDIANQTNLLALNAAIEAARAGEQGRGFAVVADEVRKLAERTTSSAEEVNDIIGRLSGKVTQVTATMESVVGNVKINKEVSGQTAQTIEDMVANVVETARSNHGISEASREQLEQFGQLQATMETLFGILQESGTKVEATAAIGDNLYEVTERLNRIMAGFTFNSERMIEPAQNEKRRYPRAHNSLLAHVTHGTREFEAVAQDFSLSGIRLSLTEPLRQGDRVGLALFMPYDDLDRYKSQTPLRLAGHVAWQRDEGDRHLCGIEFADLDPGARGRLMDCFEYYHKNAEF